MIIISSFQITLALNHANGAILTLERTGAPLLQLWYEMAG